jgi:hypothetical protein
VCVGWCFGSGEAVSGLRPKWFPVPQAFFEAIYVVPKMCFCTF